MWMAFIVRQSGFRGEEMFETVQDAFSKGGAKEQRVEIVARKVDYPAAYYLSPEGQYYGPILRP